MLLLGRPPAYHNIPEVNTGAQVPPKRPLSIEKANGGGGCGGPAGRTLMRAALHHGCVSRRQPRHMGTSSYHRRLCQWRTASLATTGGSDRSFCVAWVTWDRARRTAPVLACLWRIGRRAPTRRCAVRSSPGRQRIRCPLQGNEGRKEVAVSLRLVSAVTLPMHGCLFW